MFAKSKVQQIALWVMAADFPLLYLGAVTFENTVLTALALSHHGGGGSGGGHSLLG